MGSYQSTEMSLKYLRLSSQWTEYLATSTFADLHYPSPTNAAQRIALSLQSPHHLRAFWRKGGMWETERGETDQLGSLKLIFTLSYRFSTLLTLLRDFWVSIECLAVNSWPLLSMTLLWELKGLEKWAELFNFFGEKRIRGIRCLKKHYFHPRP